MFLINLFNRRKESEVLEPPFFMSNDEWYNFDEKAFCYKLTDGRVNINTIRAMMGHADERTTYKSYVFDRSDREEKARQIESALS